MPGFDRSRIVHLTEQELDEFTCAICLSIFDNPMVSQCCRQTYCKDCITKWVSEHESCPNDRTKLRIQDLRPVPRVLINLLDNIKIKCEYEMDGCSQVVRMGDLSKHLNVCEYGPNQLCKICGLMRECVSTHQCFQSLIIEKEKIEAKYLKLIEENSELLSEKQENQQIMSTLRKDLAQLKKDHQLNINKLKSKHLSDIKEMKLNHGIRIENEKKTYEKELDNMRQKFTKNVASTKVLIIVAVVFFGLIAIIVGESIVIEETEQRVSDFMLKYEALELDISKVIESKMETLNLKLKSEYSKTIEELRIKLSSDRDTHEQVPRILGN